MRRQSARGLGRGAGPLFASGLLLVASCAPSDAPAGEALGTTERPFPVRPGIDVLLSDSLHLVQGRRIGLITNHTGVGANGVPSIDRLHDHPEIELVALFAPEHGIRGTFEAGVEVPDDTDPRTGLPIHSLYGGDPKPTPAMLEGIEVLLFDVQDVGARYYTYPYHMALAMEAAGDASVRFVVLDRPNPVGGRLVQGNVLDSDFSSFVGRYPIPMRHGMTVGELALLFHEAFGIDVELSVVPMDGWSRDMLYSDTGLEWRAPSPNMPNLESALHYPGTCLFEGTNLSVGRGTDRAFQWIGAPWLDGDALAAIMTRMDFPGVRFHPVTFTPQAPGDGKFGGVEVEGVRLEVTDALRYDPTRTAVALLVETRRMSGERWEWIIEHFDRLAGTQTTRNGVERGEPEFEITRSWARQLDDFGELRERFLIYR